MYMLGEKRELIIWEDWLSSIGSVNSWSAQMRVNMATITMEARTSGVFTWRAVRTGPAPSTTAASITSRGTAWRAA